MQNPPQLARGRDGPFGRRDFLRDGRTVPRRLNDRRDGVRRDTSFFSHYKFSAPDSHPAPPVFRAFADDKRMVTCLHIRGTPTLGRASTERRRMASHVIRT